MDGTLAVLLQALHVRLDKGRWRIIFKITAKEELSDLGVTRKPSAFVMQQTKGFFNALGLPEGFLHKDPEVWLQDSDCGAALKIVQGLKLVSDAAEGGVA